MSRSTGSCFLNDSLSVHLANNIISLRTVRSEKWSPDMCGRLYTDYMLFIYLGWTHETGR